MKKIEQIQKRGQEALELAKKTLALSQHAQKNPIQPIIYNGEVCSDEVNKKRFAQSLSNVNSFLSAYKIERGEQQPSIIYGTQQEKMEQLAQSLKNSQQETDVLRQSIISQEEYYTDRETQILMKLKQLDSMNQHLTEQNLTLQKQLKESQIKFQELKQQLLDAQLKITNVTQQKQIYQNKLAMEMKKTATLQYQLSLVIQSSFTDFNQQELIDLFKLNKDEVLPKDDGQLNDIIEHLDRKIEIIGNVNEFIDKVDKIQAYETEIQELRQQVQQKDLIISDLKSDRQQAIELLKRGSII